MICSKENLNKCTVKQLKDFCKKLQLIKTGNKPILIKRIQDHLNDTQKTKKKNYLNTQKTKKKNYFHLGNTLNDCMDFYFYKNPKIFNLTFPPKAREIHSNLDKLGLNCFELSCTDFSVEELDRYNFIKKNPKNFSKYMENNYDCTLKNGTTFLSFYAEVIKEIRKIQFIDDIRFYHKINIIGLRPYLSDQIYFEDIIRDTVRALSHEVFFKIADKTDVSGRQIKIDQDFVVAMTFESLCKALLLCPVCNSKLYAEHLTYRGDLVCSNPNCNVDIECKLSKHRAEKFLRSKLLKDKITKYAAYMQCNKKNDTFKIIVKKRNQTNKIYEIKNVISLEQFIKFAIDSQIETCKLFQNYCDLVFFTYKHKFMDNKWYDVKIISKNNNNNNYTIQYIGEYDDTVNVTTDKIDLLTWYKDTKCNY